MKINKFLTSTAMLAMLPMASSAALITWDSSVSMYADGVGVDGDDSFVDNTTGDFVLAFSATDAGTTATGTLNGVTFGQATDTDLEGAGYTDNGVTVTVGAARSTGTAYTDGGFTGDADINNLLQGGIFDASTLTISGLTIGDTYIVQMFVNDARGGRAAYQVGFSDGTQSFDDSFTATTAGLAELSNEPTENSGDYIIGTFVADATTQSFEYRGTRNDWSTQAGSTAQINGMQLRTIAVPEPSSTALLGLGGLALILRRRK